MQLRKRKLATEKSPSLYLKKLVANSWQLTAFPIFTAKTTPFTDFPTYIAHCLLPIAYCPFSFG
jgi:hypothetical protein